MTGELSHVYIIGSEAGPKKIGVSRNPMRRLAQLQTASPTPMRLLFSVPCAAGVAAAIERCAHDELSSHRLSGEWFDVDVERAIGVVGAAADCRGGEFGALAAKPATHHNSGAPVTMTPRQCRAARAALNLTRSELATAAAISGNTIARFETRIDDFSSLNRDSLRALEACFARLGLTFPDGRTILGMPAPDDRTMVLPG